MDFTHGIALLIALDQDDDQGVEEVLEELLVEDRFLDAVRKALASAAIGDPQRRQLLVGLDRLQARDYVIAAPLLLVAFEGTLWLSARDQAILDFDDKNKARASAASTRRVT